jgi:hypothetical protein
MVGTVPGRLSYQAHKATFPLRDRARCWSIVIRRNATVPQDIYYLLTKNETTVDGDILASLRPNYLTRLEARVSNLCGFAETLGKGALAPQQRDELHRTAHSMASSAAIFGHAGLSAAARAVEQTFEQSDMALVEQRVTLFRLLNEAERVLLSGL